MCKSERVLWIDIYKALAIVLVVVGHSTGKFNLYIYQFHLAAFFLISGYVAKQNDLSIWRVIYNKAYSLLLPLFTFVFLNACGMALLVKFGYYDKFFGEYAYIGFFSIIKEFFSGKIYAWLLGAGWFLIVLFCSSILSKILLNISNGNKNYYLVYSILLYIFVYFCIKNKVYMQFKLLYQIMVAQFFYCVGYWVKEKGKNYINSINNKNCLFVVVLITLIVMVWLSKFDNVSIDYASYSFSSIILNTISSFNGIIFLFCISKLISLNSFERIHRIFQFMGCNTMGIVLLHFCFFKIGYIILIWCDKMPIEDLALIVPTQEMGIKYWWILSILAIVGSLGMWKAISAIPIFDILIGTNSKFFKELYKKLENNALSTFYHKGISKIANTLKSKMYMKKSAMILFAMILLGNGVFYGRFYYVHSENQVIDIEFPDKYGVAEYTGGWLEQSYTENYRWICKDATVLIETKRCNEIIIEGYVPEEFEEVKELKIYINGKLIDNIDVKKNAAFVCQHDLQGVIEDDNSEIEIVFKFNSEHQPDQDSADKRVLSGMIKSIYID